MGLPFQSNFICAGDVKQYLMAMNAVHLYTYLHVRCKN